MNTETAIAKPAANPAAIFKNNITAEVQSSTLPLTALKPIASAAEKEIAERLLQAAKKTRAAVETIRKNTTDPLVAAQKAYIQAEKDFTAQMDTQIARVTGLINKFNNDELVRVRKEQEEARQLAAKEAARKRSEQGVANVEIKLQATTQQIQATAPTGIKTRHVFRSVTNAALVPREYLSVDPAKVAEAIKNGVKTIPGILIEEEAIRTGRA